MKLCSLVSIALVLTVIIGCDRMELLEYDNIVSYESLDRNAMAPPDMSLEVALNTIKNPPANDPALLNAAISIVMNAMGLKTSSIGDPSQTYSIDGMVMAIETTLKNSGINLSATILKSIIISAINEAIYQVNSGSLDRTEPENAGLFALAEGIQQRTGKTVITIEDADNPNLIDTAGFLVLTTAMNQALNSRVDSYVSDITHMAIQRTIDEVNSVIPEALNYDIAAQLVPRLAHPEEHLLGGFLTNVVGSQMVSTPEFLMELNSQIGRNINSGELSDAIDEQIKSQVSAEMTTTLKQMQSEGKLQGISIPDQMDLNVLKDVLTKVEAQASANDLAALKQQISSSSFQDKVVNEIKTDITTHIENVIESGQTKVEDFVKATAQEIGTTVNVEPIVPPHNQGSVIIQ
jgi:hypothetical protein